MSESPRSIERLERPAPRVFRREYVRKCRPVVITGVADRWPARTLWTPEYFRENFADARVTYTAWETEGPSNDPAVYYRERKRLTTRLGEFIDRMNSGDDSSRNYVSQFPIFRAVPELRRDVLPLDDYTAVPRHYPERLRRRLTKEPALWLGPAGTVTPVHFDAAHNLLVQLHGRKRLLLIPPSQSRALYYPSLELGHVNYSPVDVEAPDLERFPRFAGATPLEVWLEPGDILFIPVRWWHHVRAHGPTVSLNFWWFSADSLRRMWHPYLVYKRSRLLARLKGRRPADAQGGY